MPGVIPLPMYANTKLERWETPIVGAHDLRTVSVVDDGELLITVSEPSNDDRYRLRFRFRAGKYLAYRVTNEIDGCQLLDEARYDGERPCRTFTGEQSDWKERFLEVSLRGQDVPLKHYVIWTEEDIIEVLASEPPEAYDL